MEGSAAGGLLMPKQLWWANAGEFQDIRTHLLTDAQSLRVCPCGLVSCPWSVCVSVCVYQQWPRGFILHCVHPINQHLTKSYSNSSSSPSPPLLSSPLLSLSSSPLLSSPLLSLSSSPLPLLLLSSCPFPPVFLPSPAQWKSLLAFY